MIVRVGKATYTVPTTSINTSIQPEIEDITHTMDGQEIVHVRNRLVPVVRMGDLFDVEADNKELNEGILMVVEKDNDLVCLFVDEMIGQQQVVIKGLSDYLGRIPGVSGCTILGDGSVSLIIDIAGLVDSVQFDKQAVE
jgi:two-component system chemotaxis sensor kinase CheA